MNQDPNDKLQIETIQDLVETQGQTMHLEMLQDYLFCLLKGEELWVCFNSEAQARKVKLPCEYCHAT